MPPAWTYLGSDIESGANVDIVQTGPYTIQREREQYDLVISGQTLEHVERPWLLVREMARMLKPKGWLVITAPFECPVHKHPIDCWRFLPFGFHVLFQEAGLRTVKVWLCGRLCWGVAQKGNGNG